MVTASINPYFGLENSRSLQTLFDFMDAARAGIPKKDIAVLAKNLHLAQADLLVILHISARTWQRYTDEALMSPDVTERALQLAALYQHGRDVFGSVEKFQGWMHYPSLFFRSKKPIELLDTSFGFKAVEDELIRIDYGVLA